MRYGAGTIKWNKEKLQGIDRKSRKIMTMNKELHPRSDVARIYVPRKKGGRGLTSCESCVRREEKYLSWYVRNGEEALLSKVGDSNVHDNVARYIHWQLCGKCGLERANSWCEQKPEGVVESENFKILIL